MRILAAKLLDAGKPEGVKTLLKDGILDESFALTDRGRRVVESLVVVELFDKLVEYATGHLNLQAGNPTAPAGK